MSWETSARSSAWLSTLRRNLALAGAILSLLLAFFAFRPPPTTGPFMRDFESYYAAGATWNAGGDPYSRDIWRAERAIPGVVATRDELLPFVGPAAYRPLWSMLARVPYVVAMRIWGAILIAALFVLVLGSLWLADAPRDARTIFTALLLAFSSGPIISDIALGQVALVSAGAVVGTLVALRLHAWTGSVAAIALAAIQPNIALVLLARMRDRRAILSAAIAFAIFLAAAFAFGGGPAGLITYVRVLAAHARAERFITIQHTVTAIAYGFGTQPTAAGLTGVTIAIFAFLVAIVGMRRLQLGPVEATALACAALPLIIPFFHEHDFAIELFPAIVLAVRARGVALLLAAVGTLFAATDWLGLSQRANGQWQLVAFVIALGLAFVALSGETRNRMTFVPAIGVALLLLALAPFAQQHIAPTWPDFLTEYWKAPIGWSVADVWHAEQVASGLEAREPAWSLLRAFPLLGCTLLGAAIALDARRRSIIG